MIRFITLAFVAFLALAGCGEDGPYNSRVQMQPGTTRARLALEPAFVEAADGTLYAIDCLRTRGAAIAAGQAGAGRECAVDRLNESQVRGLRGYFSNSSNYRYINPIHYYGGNQQNLFCSVYFGWSWNGCFQWLGYSPQQHYNTQYYYPECRDCMFTMYSTTSPTSGYGFGGSQPQYWNSRPSCPDYCRYVSNLNSQPWYQNWQLWNWLNWFF